MAAKDLDSSDIKTRKQDDLEDITICCICSEVYTDPKLLPCIHTFCMKCIQKTGLKCDKGPGDEMPCPLCRRLFKIPPEGFPDLPKNFFIDRLIQQVSKLSNRSTASTAVCSLCLQESNEKTSNETPAAKIYCVDCKHSLCENCCSEHRKYKLNKNHNLIPIDEYENGPKVMAELDPLVCEVHEQKALDVYCVDCKSVVCAICFIEEHRPHKGSYVNNCVDGFRRHIENNTESLNACISQVQMKKLDILTVKEAIDKRAESLECDVQRRTAEIKQIADEHASRLLQGLCSERQSQQKEIKLVTDDIDTYQVILENYNSYCKEIMIKGSAGDICRAVSDLSSRAIELEQQCQPIMDRGIQDFNFCFRQSELEELLKKGCVNLVGKIEVRWVRFSEDSDPKTKESSKQGSKETCLGLEHELQIARTDVLKEQMLENNKKLDELREKYKSDPILVHTFKTISVKKKNWNIFGFSIRRKSSKEEDVAPFIGMTILGKELFVLVASSSEVEVHDSITFNFSRQLKLKEFNWFLDIASCSRNKCLYIFHYTPRVASGEILRIDPHGKVIKKWSTGVDCGIGLSVTSDSNVILAINEKHKLNEYSADGQLIREINLSEAGIVSPLHGIKLANGDFLVSHGGFHEDDDDHGVHRVCIVDADGKLKKSYGVKRGASVGQMDGPTSLSVDVNGFVMVADSGNRRVLLLNSDLEFKRELLSREKHGLGNPIRILLDESMDRLFVVNYLRNSEIWIVVLYCK